MFTYNHLITCHGYEPRKQPGCLVISGAPGFCFPHRERRSATSNTFNFEVKRTAPPQCAASVLKPLWVRHLGVSLNIRTTGSRISIGKPSTESCLLYAGHRLHSIQNSPAGLSLRRNRPQLSISKENFTTPQRRFGFTHLSVQHLTNHCSPFPQRSRPSLLMTAA